MEVSKIKVAAVRDFENNIAKNEADVAGCQCYSNIWNFNLKCSIVFNIFVSLVIWKLLRIQYTWYPLWSWLASY